MSEDIDRAADAAEKQWIRPLPDPMRAIVRDPNPYGAIIDRAIAELPKEDDPRVDHMPTVEDNY